MKRKLTALFLLAALVVTLAACGGKDTDKVSEAAAAEEVVAAEEAAAAEEAVAGAGEAAEAVSEAAEEEAVTEETTTEAETSIFELGTTEGLTYENASIGIGCTLPEGWVAYDEDQIAEMNGIVLDNVAEDVRKQLENATYIYDMMASDADGINNVNVIVQNLSLLQAMSLTDSADLEEALKATEDSLISTIEGMGAENVSFQIERGRTFPAKLYTCARLTGEISGLQLTEQLVMYKSGNHLVNITAATFGDDLTDEILDAFYEVK